MRRLKVNVDDILNNYKIVRAHYNDKDHWFVYSFTDFRNKECNSDEIFDIYLKDMFKRKDLKENQDKAIWLEYSGYRLNTI